VERELKDDLLADWVLESLGRWVRRKGIPVCHQPGLPGLTPRQG
jgi:hypothetical protein